MNRRSLLPLTLLIAALTGGAWRIIVRQSGGETTETNALVPPAPAAVAAGHAPVVPLGALPPAMAAASGTPAHPSTAAAAFPIGDGFVPGHFPGVTVRDEPGTHRPTPPAGTPRTLPKEQEIVLPDGRRLIGVTLDETWRIPFRAETPP